MDAREQLRRYLEQRREMGETELVLDRMTVDEALRLLGGGAPGKARDAGFARRRRAARADRPTPAIPNGWRASRLTGGRWRRSEHRATVDRWTGRPVDR